MKKETPILFSTPMVQAILQDKKCMTRRIIKYKKEIIDPKIGFSCFTGHEQFSVRGTHKDGTYGESFFKMPYKKWDILWVRETFAPVNGGELFIYKADFDSECLKDKNFIDWKWKPSLFMPRKACRLFLEITDIKIESLHDITEEDAIKEGIIFYQDEIGRRYKDYLSDASEYGHPDHDYPTVSTTVESFKTLWKSINGEESWNNNPWVWCISFKRIDK